MFHFLDGLFGSREQERRIKQLGSLYEQCVESRSGLLERYVDRGDTVRELLKEKERLERRVDAGEKIIAGLVLEMHRQRVKRSWWRFWRKG